jgi:hypothetical protein
MKPELNRSASGFGGMKYDPLFAAFGGLIASLAAGVGPGLAVAVALASGATYWGLRHRSSGN